MLDIHTNVIWYGDVILASTVGCAQRERVDHVAACPWTPVQDEMAAKQHVIRELVALSRVAQFDQLERESS